jgi:hypothetical protein
MSKNGKDNLVHCIGKLAKLTQKLARVAEQQYLAEVEAILKSKSGDSGRIERCLDGMLDFCFDDVMPALYKKLCRHYFDIDPKATVFYVSAYREMWDEQKSGKSEDLLSTRKRLQRRTKGGMTVNRKMT